LPALDLLQVIYYPLQVVWRH